MKLNEKLKTIIEYGQRFIGEYSEDEINSASILFIQYHKKIEYQSNKIEKGKLYTFLMFQDEVGFYSVYKVINDLSDNNLQIDWEMFCRYVDKVKLRKGYKGVLT